MSSNRRLILSKKKQAPIFQLQPFMTAIGYTPIVLPSNGIVNFSSASFTWEFQKMFLDVMSKISLVNFKSFDIYIHAKKTGANGTYMTTLFSSQYTPEFSADISNNFVRMYLRLPDNVNQTTLTSSTVSVTNDVVYHFRHEVEGNRYILDISYSYDPLKIPDYSTFNWTRVMNVNSNAVNPYMAFDKFFQIAKNSTVGNWEIFLFNGTMDLKYLEFNFNDSLKYKWQ